MPISYSRQDKSVINQVAMCVNFPAFIRNLPENTHTVWNKETDGRT